MLQPPPHLLVRNLWPCLLVCWMQMLSLLAQQHWFCLWAVDVHFPFLSPSPRQRSNWSFLPVWLSGSGRCCCAWSQGWRCKEGSCQEPAPAGISPPLAGFLAESSSHSHRHLFRSGLSEAWTAGALEHGARRGSKLWLQQYDLLRIDGLHLTVRDSGGVVAHTWASHPGSFDTLLSAYVLRCLLNLGFYPFFYLFHLAHSSFPALPSYVQTRTGTNFLQFGCKLKAKQPSLKHPLCFDGQGGKSLGKNICTTLAFLFWDQSFFFQIW